MNIGIVDADLLCNGTRHPNLALMKISGFHKSKGNNVELIESYNESLDKFDQIFISKVFDFTEIPEKFMKNKKIIIGGTGFFEDGGEDLPYEIEHHKPDYELYKSYINKKVALGKSLSYFDDYLNYSIGFTTRGCFRQCSFCVNKKYNKVFRHSPVSEFIEPSKKYIHLWDDNFLGYPEWESILDEIEQTGKPFQFRQGLDIRLLTEEKAYRLSKSKYRGDMIFAFDHILDRDLIEKKLKIWRKYSFRTTKLYVLTGYESNDHVDIMNTFERIKILMKYQCLPYIMRYSDYKNSRWVSLYTQVARWCNQPQFFKKMSFRDFCLANQKFHKTKGTFCSAMKALTEFEKTHPDIANIYFDIRFDMKGERE
jgi:hypothetical protein